MSRSNLCRRERKSYERLYVSETEKRKKEAKKQQELRDLKCLKTGTEYRKIGIDHDKRSHGDRSKYSNTRPRHELKSDFYGKNHKLPSMDWVSNKRTVNLLPRKTEDSLHSSTNAVDAKNIRYEAVVKEMSKDHNVTKKKSLKSAPMSLYDEIVFSSTSKQIHLEDLSSPKHKSDDEQILKSAKKCLPVFADSERRKEKCNEMQNEENNWENLNRLGAVSENKLRQDKAVRLPDSADYYFAMQKERYFNNMYRLIVTARQQVQRLKSEIKALETKLDGQNHVKCPSCSHKFKTTDNRYLPNYVKILHSSSTAELTFDNSQHLQEWLLLTGLDKDAEGIPTYFPKPAKHSRITLADVNSRLCEIKTDNFLL